MKMLYSCCVLLILVVTPVFSQAQESLALYDDFNDEFLDGARWWGQDHVDGNMTLLESVRVIDRPQVKAGSGRPGHQSSPPPNGRLRLANRTYRNPAFDTGTSLSNTRVRFSNPENITSIQATVEVQDVQAKGCNSNPEPTQARARIQGFFFNTDTPTEYSGLNDVTAQIVVRRRSNSSDPSGVMEVYGVVYHCNDADCADATELGYADLGTIELGKKVKLRMTWDPDNDRFIFGKGGLEVYSPYTVSDASPAGALNKRMEVSNLVANCTTLPRPVAYMDVLFDNVLVNQSAVP